MKDNFSIQAKKYSKYRPDYSYRIIDYIVSKVLVKHSVLDVATGNGQVANKLADYFEDVFATDISTEQLKNAIKKENIVYKQERAENTSFNDNQFDLITVAQAIHWFDFEIFYKEVTRLLKPTGTLVVMGYGQFSTNLDSDKLINHLHKNILGSYWDEERKYVDENYETIPFPFEEIKTDEFVDEFTWSFDHLLGYIDSWSATQHYIKKNGSNPVNLIKEELKESWNNNDKKVTFPLLLRIGKMKK
ncbi:MAG: SAM-dependent methyltransferase [Flavobacterium sp. MedPE-SWcel]|nr:class I SAM-dependent methyltransferase [uncultured Flavobacterium sp.]OIQ17328.1 MAG: SAM-dependent methyltransferase [Flavobacterium sp. MedPE-SWcel]